MRHRPEYINRSAPYVRPALYAHADWQDADELRAVAGQLENPVWRWIRWAAAAVALVVLACLFAYGVIAIRRETVAPGPARSWVTPSTYGAPGPNGGPR